MNGSRSGGVLAAFIMSLGLALVITAATLPGRQTPDVISALSKGGVQLTEASLGERPAGT